MHRPTVPLVLWALFVAGCAAPPPPVTATVWIVRHAEAYKNLDPVPDMPPERLDSLTQQGIEQAEAIAATLRGTGVTRVLHSPTGRTTETARSIARACGVPAEPTATLAPLTGGTTPSGAPATWAWREAAWADGRDPRPEGGESMGDGLARARPLVDDLPDGAVVVLVTHGDIAAALIGEAAGTPVPKRFARHAPPGGSATRLAFRADGSVVLDTP